MVFPVTRNGSCPYCKSLGARRSRRKGLLERTVLSAISVYPYPVDVAQGGTSASGPPEPSPKFWNLRNAPVTASAGIRFAEQKRRALPYAAGIIAIARTGLPDPFTIFSGAAITTAPVAGSR